MDTAFELLGYAHWVVFAGIIVGYFLSLPRLKISPVMVWSARVQLLLGLTMISVAEGGSLLKLNHAWVGAKLVVALAVVACCEIAAARDRAHAKDRQAAVVAGAGASGPEAHADANPPARHVPLLLHSAFVLTAVNFLIARLWT